MKFQCIEGCAQCCIEREYYPGKKFGKIGVLILPFEKGKIESLARENDLKISILPRIGLSKEKDSKSIEVIAYQMMGIEKNGNTCPFLDTKTENKSPHGGYPCKIYKDRPLACKAYPLIESNPITLDTKCKFCKERGCADENLDHEMESLIKIKKEMDTNLPFIWRYATGIGDEEDIHQIKDGWILEE